MSNPYVWWGVACMLMGLCAGAAAQEYDSILLVLVGVALLITSVVLTVKGIGQNIRQARAHQQALEESALHRSGDEDINAQIKRLKGRIKACWILFAALMLLLIAQLAAEIDSAILIIANLTALVTLLFVQGVIRRKLESYVSDTVLQQVLEGVFTNVTHIPGHRIPENVLRESNMGLPYFERSDGEDYIKAAYKGISFEMCDINLKKETTTTDADGKVTSGYESVFRGIMLQCDLGRMLPAQLRIWSDYGLDSGGVQTGNAAFDRIFHVESDDPIYLSRMLTPWLQAQLLQRKSGPWGSTHMRFERSGQVWIAIRTGGDFFELGRGKQLDAAIIRRRFTQETAFVTDVLDILAAWEEECFH